MSLSATQRFVSIMLPEQWNESKAHQDKKMQQNINLTSADAISEVRSLVFLFHMGILEWNALLTVFSTGGGEKLSATVAA